LLTGLKYFSIPPIPVVHSVFYKIHIGVREMWHGFTRIFWYTPLFQSRLEEPAPNLYLYGGMPFILGSVRIRLGKGCRVGGGLMNIGGRTTGTQVPLLEVGDNVDLGWNAALMVGTKIRIGNNVRLAEGTFLAGYSGHSMDAEARARGEGDAEETIGDIVLEDDVWIATRVTVLSGVTIGRGTIVGTGSVVTKDLPPFVLAAGNPARIIRKLNPGLEADSAA